MWEYRRLVITYKNNCELDEELQKLGDDGWEIIHFYEVPIEKLERAQKTKILAKRPKKNENKDSN